MCVSTAYLLDQCIFLFSTRASSNNRRLPCESCNPVIVPHIYKMSIPLGASHVPKNTVFILPLLEKMIDGSKEPNNSKMTSLDLSQRLKRFATNTQ